MYLSVEFDNGHSVLYKHSSQKSRDRQLIKYPYNKYMFITFYE